MLLRSIGVIVAVMLVDVLGVLAVLSSMVRSWPQVMRIVVRDNASGVSALTWSLSFSCGMSWVVYGIASGLYPPLIANLLTGGGVLAILLVLIRKDRSLLFQTLAVIAAVILTDAVVAALIGFSAIGIIAAAISIVQFIPQALTASQKDISGVSPATWFLVLGSSIIWGTYGFLVGEWVLIVGTLVVVPCAAVVLGQLILKTRAVADT